MNFSWSMIAWSTNLCQAIIFNPTVLSLPLRFQGSFQLYIQIDDEDRIGGVGSTDRVADIYIHKNLNNSSPLSRMTYQHGVMNHITIELSFQVVCGRNFNGIDCSECIPGWTSLNSTGIVSSTWTLHGQGNKFARLNKCELILCNLLVTCIYCIIPCI